MKVEGTMEQGRRNSHSRAAKTRSAWEVWIWILSSSLAGLGAITCGDTSYLVLDRCSDDYDCIEIPGTACVNDICVCAGKDEAYCDDTCKPAVECSTGSAGGAGGGGGGNGGTSGGECKTTADCPQPGNPRCGEATCEDGLCGLKLVPFSKLSSQVRGDCKNLWCDGAGNLVEIEDAIDTFNDGAQCTVDACEEAGPKNTSLATGAQCPETGVGFCFEGACVTCINNVQNACSGGLICVGTYCVPAHCDNNSWDKASGETAFNCGGPCRPCPQGSPCNKPADCLHGVCTNGSCDGPACSDGVRNGNETGIDCGGPPSCPRCKVGQGCKASSDCFSGVCWAGVCEAPSCNDGVLNGDEKDWDCGGSCAPCP